MNCFQCIDIFIKYNIQSSFSTRIVLRYILAKSPANVHSLANRGSKVFHTLWKPIDFVIQSTILRTTSFLWAVLIVLVPTHQLLLNFFSRRDLNLVMRSTKFDGNIVANLQERHESRDVSHELLSFLSGSIACRVMQCRDVRDYDIS